MENRGGTPRIEPCGRDQTEKGDRSMVSARSWPTSLYSTSTTRVLAILMLWFVWLLTVTAADVVGMGDPKPACWRLANEGTCGDASTGPLIECDVGQEPSFIETSPPVWYCAGTHSGWSHCNDDAEEVCYTRDYYECVDGVYTHVGSAIIDCCDRAVISDVECP